MGPEGIFGAVQVTGDHIAVGKGAADPVHRVKIVFSGIVRVDHQLHTEFVDQIFILLLQKAHDHPDVPDERLMELADEAVNEPFPVDLQKALGGLGVDGYHPHPEARRQDHRPLRMVFRKQRLTVLGQGAVGTDIPRFRQGPEAPVHHPQGVAALLRQLPLAGEGPTGKDVQNILLLPVHVQTSILFREHKTKKHLPTGENDFPLFYTAAWKKSRGKGKIIRKEIVVPWPSRVGAQESNGGA